MERSKRKSISSFCHKRIQEASKDRLSPLLRTLLCPLSRDLIRLPSPDIYVRANRTIREGLKPRPDTGPTDAATDGQGQHKKLLDFTI